MPGKPGLHLRQIGIRPANQYLAQTTPVLVCFVALYLDMFGKHQVREMLFGALTKSLGFLRGVNTSQADSICDLAGVQDVDGVSI